jgi:hypothetical protein
MSMIDRFRDRRDANRRARALERALSKTNSPAVREEIMAIASRWHHSS